MTHKKIKAALVLGLITLAIIGFCAFQQGLIFKARMAVVPDGQATTTLTEAELTAQLDKVSGNRGYDSWSSEKKAAFKAEQLRILESLKVR